MQTEIVYIMGFWGWLGWVVAAGTIALYIHLWRSIGGHNLRKLTKQLADASKLIGALQEENHKLQNRNDFLRTRLNTLEANIDESNKKYASLQERFEAATLKQRKELVELAKGKKFLHDLVDKQSVKLAEQEAAISSLVSAANAADKRMNEMATTIHEMQKRS